MSAHEIARRAGLSPRHFVAPAPNPVLEHFRSQRTEGIPNVSMARGFLSTMGSLSSHYALADIARARRVLIRYVRVFS